MKVLLINNSHEIRGGADRVYINMSKMLEENGHDVYFFSVINENSLKTNSNKYFIKSKNIRKNNIADKINNVANYLFNNEAYKNLEDLIKDVNPDIAHIHLFYGGLSTSILKTLNKYNIVTINTVHDYRLLCPANAFLNSKNEICEKCKPNKYYNCLINKCSDNNIFYSSVLTAEAYMRKYYMDPLDYIDHFIFVSKFSRMKHIEYDSRYFDKSSHSYNFSVSNNKEIEKIKGNYFLFFGRISKEKGISTLLSVILKLGLEIKIVGDGPLKNELENNYIHNKNISFYGHKSGKDLTNFIKNSSFVIVPSEWYENNPMTIIESYTYGKPVIGSNIGGIPEIIINNETGFLFKHGDTKSLKEILIKANSIEIKEYYEFSRNSFAFANNHFSKENHYNDLIKLYHSQIKMKALNN